MNRITFCTTFSTALSAMVKMKILMVACLNNVTPPLLLREFNGNVATLFYDLQYKAHKEPDCVSLLSLCHPKQQVQYYKMRFNRTNIFFHKIMFISVLRRKVQVRES